MEVKRFFSATMQEALRLVREELGADAVILSNSKVDGGVEIVAALDYEEEWDKEPVKVEIANHGEPSPSQIARMHAEKHLQLQREMDQAKRKIEALRAKKYPDQAMNKSLSAQVNAKVAEPAATNNASTMDADSFQAMRAEILEIKALLAKQPEQAHVNTNANKPILVEQQVDKMAESLCLSRATKELIRTELSQYLKRSHTNTAANETQFETAWKYLTQFIEKSIRTEFTEIIDRQGVFALVGPTGSGKTMTIGKMAARYVMEYGADNIALVTTDRYRIAAHEQLKVFGRILNVPVHTVDETHSLDRILDKLSSKKIVLIDTAGLMHTDTCWTEQLQEIRLSKHRIECYLTVSAVGQYQVMSSIYQHYKMVNLAGAIVTKVDEAVSLGEALSFLLDTKLKAAYFTDGQRVPEDIHLFDAHSMLERAQTLLNSAERWITIKGEGLNGAVYSSRPKNSGETILFHSA